MTSQSNQSLNSVLCVGVDVAKATLEVAFSDRETTFTVSNDAVGHQDLVAHMRNGDQGKAIGIVVIEATGDLELSAATELQLAGYPVAIINPRYARDFARSMVLAPTEY